MPWWWSHSEMPGLRPDTHCDVWLFCLSSIFIQKNSFLHIKFCGGQPRFYRKFDQIIL
jgi:hypothetical protein